MAINKIKVFGESRKFTCPQKKYLKPTPPHPPKNPRLLIYLIWVPFAWRSANTCVWTIWVRVVQACSCQRKAKKYFFFPFSFLSFWFFFFFKFYCKEQFQNPSFWDCVRDAGGSDGADYLRMKTESLSALRGRGRLSCAALLSDSPSLAFTCKSLCAGRSRHFQSLTFPWRVLQLPQQNLSLLVRKGFPTPPFLPSPPSLIRITEWKPIRERVRPVFFGSLPSRVKSDAERKLELDRSRISARK